MPLATGATVYDVGDEMDRLYFSSSGIASLQMIMKDGRAIDTAIVGRDGALGAMAAHAPCRAAVRCVVRSTITAFTISALEYRRAAASEAALQMLVIQYQDTRILRDGRGDHHQTLLHRSTPTSGDHRTAPAALPKRTRWCVHGDDNLGALTTAKRWQQRQSQRADAATQSWRETRGYPHLPPQDPYG